MSKLLQGSRDELVTIRLNAISHFAPIMLHEALLSLCNACGNESLDRFEKAMIAKIERCRSEIADFDDMKEFATEQLYVSLREVRASPDMLHAVEHVENRRTDGRSEEPDTLEDQLQMGLEDSFPASDPPAVTSTTIPGRAKNLVGTDEVLRRKKR
jgi:hypothetical protein